MPAQQDDQAAQIRAVVERWAQAVRDHDLEGILAAHANTIVMFDVPPPLQAKGLEAYAKTWEQFFAFQDKGAFDLNELEITASDTVAFCHSIVTCGTPTHRVSFRYGSRLAWRRSTEAG